MNSNIITKRIALLVALADNDPIHPAASSLERYIKVELKHDVRVHPIRTLEDFEKQVEDLKVADSAILFCHANSDELGLPDSTRLEWREFGELMGGALSDKSVFLAGCAIGAESTATRALSERLNLRLLVAPESNASIVELYPAVKAFCVALAHDPWIDGQGIASLITGFKQQHLQQELDTHEAAGHGITDGLRADLKRSQDLRFRVECREGGTFSTYYSDRTDSGNRIEP